MSVIFLNFFASLFSLFCLFGCRNLSDGNRREKGKRAKVVKKKREHGGGDTYQTGGLGKPITFAQLTEGVQMLGVVTTVRRNTIQVSLPFNLVGYLDSSETLLDAEKMNVDSLQDMPDEG